MVVILSRGLPLGNKRTHGFASKAMSQKTFRVAPSLGFSMNMNNVAMLTRQSLGVNATPDKVRREVSSRLRQYFVLLPSDERNAYFVRAGCTPDEAAIESALQGASEREGFPAFAATKSTNMFCVCFF